MGIALVILACLGAFVLSVPAASHTGLMTWLSIACAATSFVAMAINQVLATRWKVLEPLFGGLDRVYRVHKWTGISAFALFLVHYFVTPDFKGKLLASALNNFAAGMGRWGFYGLTALIAISIFKRLPRTKYEFPYRIWRQTHRFIGVFFILIAFHFLFIKRPFDGSALLVSYLVIFAILGITAFIYTQVRSFLHTRSYVVTAVEKAHGATVITAEPVKGAIKARPGQFAFIAAGKPGLREPHPFTIAGHDKGEDGKMRLTFAIKPLGDYTTRLRDGIAVGDRMSIEGGYGRFTAQRGGNKQLWVAGGVGVTPFLAMAKAAGEMKDKSIHLFYCVREPAEAIGADRLTDAALNENFSYTLHSSNTDGRVSAEVVRDKAGFDLNGADLWFCGPPGLREALVKGFKDLGVKLARVEFERFEFR